LFRAEDETVDAMIEIAAQMSADGATPDGITDYRVLVC
jgi:hypothetical protein